MVRGGHRLGKALGPSCDLAHVVMGLLVLLPELLEKVVLEDLGGGVTFIGVVDQHFHDDILSVGGHMGDQLLDADKLFRLKVEFHVRGVLLEVV